MNIERYSQKIDNLMGLLLLADPNKSLVEEYIDNSTIYVAEESSVIIGVVVIILIDDQYEIKNLAVLESHRGRGVAKELVFTAKKYAKDRGALSIIVGTGNSSLSQLALYQKCEFRVEHIKRNYFEKYPNKIYENGILCLDMIVLSASL